MLFANELSPEESVFLLIGALFAGAVCGLWPLGAGIRKRRPGVAVTGFIACLISGVVFGCLLALPTAIFFRLLIGVLDPPPMPGGDGMGGEPFNPYAHGKRSEW